MRSAAACRSQNEISESQSFVGNQDSILSDFIIFFNAICITKCFFDLFFMNSTKNMREILKAAVLCCSLIKSSIHELLSVTPSPEGQYQLRVLTYHDVPLSCRDMFRKQLICIKKSWHFLTPDEFILIKLKKLALTKNSVLLTMDDGFFTNLLIAMSVLEELNIKAIFFVVTTFIESKSSAHARKIIQKNIIPNQQYRYFMNTRPNMNPSDLRRLVAKGHEIGSHTLTHPFISSLHSPLSVYSEIVNSKQCLFTILQKNIRFFAFPFGSYESMSIPAVRLALEHYNFVFTSLRGNNMPENSRLCFRETISLFDSHLVINSYLAGAADFIYRKQISSLLFSLN